MFRHGFSYYFGVFQFLGLVAFFGYPWVCGGGKAVGIGKMVFSGNLPKVAVELAKDWRTDKYLRRLEALLTIMDKDYTYLVSGTGDVIEPDDGVLAIGSGGNYALAAARALVENSTLNAEEIVRESLKIAAKICIYTNDNISVETL